MFKCPNCKKPTISLWDKFFVSPTLYITCGLCKSRLRASWRYTFLNWFFGFVMLSIITTILLGAKKGLLFMILYFVLCYFIEVTIVPLKKN